MRGDRAAAIDAVERAERAGWTDAMFLERDPLLAALRSEPRYVEVMRRIVSDVAAMKARADFRILDEWAGESVTATESPAR